MKFMGNVQHNVPRQKDRFGKDRPFNHENLDVHRDRTLRRLEEQKMGEIPGNAQKELNLPRSGVEPQAHSSTRLLKGSTPICVNENMTAKNCPSSYPSPVSHSMRRGQKCLTRKYLKDGKIIIEEITKEEEVTIHTSNMIQSVPSCLNHPTRAEYDSNVVGTRTEKYLTVDFLTENKQVPTFMNKLTTDEDERYYDAYLNCSDEHVGVAKRMLEVLEKPPFNFRLFFPPRQILPGGCELDMKAEIVETRCSGKVITLLSKENESSSAVHFINHFAKSLDPVSKGNKLIPVIIEDDASIPRILHGMYMIRFDRDNERGFIWEKLSKSLRKTSE